MGVNGSFHPRFLKSLLRLAQEAAGATTDAAVSPLPLDVDVQKEELVAAFYDAFAKAQEANVSSLPLMVSGIRDVPIKWLHDSGLSPSFKKDVFNGIYYPERSSYVRWTMDSRPDNGCSGPRLYKSVCRIAKNDEGEREIRGVLSQSVIVYRSCEQNSREGLPPLTGWKKVSGEGRLHFYFVKSYRIDDDDVKIEF